MNILITGGAAGLGKEITNLFYKDGHEVFILSRTNPDNLPNHFECDVSDGLQVKNTVEKITREGRVIDILINNSGIGINGALEYASNESFHKCMDVNFDGVFYLCKYVIPYLSEKGKIINISSAAGLFPLPFKSIYCASKAAVNALTFSLYNELSGTDIQVCAICPGDIKSGFSKNRIKEFETNEKYGDRIKNAAEKLDAKEEKRMPAAVAAKKIYKIINKRKLPVIKIIGFKYKIFYLAQKLLPAKCFLNMTNKKLGK